MAATEPSLAASGNPVAVVPPEKQEGANPSSNPERNSAAAWIPEASAPAPDPSSPNAAVSEATPTPPAVASAVQELPLGPAPLGSPPQAEDVPRSPPGSGGSRPGPETFLITEMLVQEQLLAILPEAARARRLRRRTDVRITG
ncbi:PREDICTED: SCAN domain-containing protein 1 [Galeopterus variegatus]|uniref:SCAN domain-containing protein 1 n=1 Tax=Galeopterus variegatus TaxID=482537 RepID=A0ABM0QRC4_GALVR|nr:PREDICTED: SCAN domain-containing protein 1 [Galeopterus variegatus]